MKTQSAVIGSLAILLTVPVALPVLAQEKAAEKKVEKAKAEKVSGDIGLLDTEKNYMIVVTKEGKLVTLDFNQKTKVTELKESPAKMADIGLGSSAVVEYSVKGEKNILSKIEFTPAKGGD
jgi:outer membrane protease